MNKITNWIKEHQVAAFFILAFTITWPLFWLIYFAFSGNSLVLILAGGPLAVFSPALAAMFISAIIEPQPKLQTRKPRLIAFGVSWLISWIIMTLYYWQVVKLDLPLAAILWAVFALLPAWILSSAYAPTPGIRKHFSSLIRPRGNLIWYLVALFSILFSWVYNRTKGSILAPALFHPSMNTFGDHFPVTPVTLGLFAALAIFAVIYDKMWKKLRLDNPAVFSRPTDEIINALNMSAV